MIHLLGLILQQIVDSTWRCAKEVSQRDYDGWCVWRFSKSACVW